MEAQPIDTHAHNRDMQEIEMYNDKVFTQSRCKKVDAFSVTM